MAVGPSFGIDAKSTPVSNTGDIERAIGALAREPNGALFAPSNPVINNNLDRIVALTVRHSLPTIGAYRFFPASGGLMSYGPNDLDQFQSAASYVDRILKGEKPSDLPVQYPTKYELVFNMKTAKALGLTVPPSVLAIADEVIE